MMTPEKYWEEVGKRILGRSGGVRISLPEGLTVDELREFIDSRNDEKIAKVMREFENGTLRSSSGELVTSREQALAIAMSEARKHG